MPTAPTAAEVGEFIDRIAGHKRTEAAVAGRLLEEAVELALAAGLSPARLMGHVMDSIHNQCLKASTAGTVFPSQLAGVGSYTELREEMADVSILLKDLEYVTRISVELAEAEKWAAFIKRTFRVSANGTVYSVKEHVK